MNSEKLFCTNCGTPLTREDRFCAECGQPVSESAPSAPVPQEEPVRESAPLPEVKPKKKRRLLKWALILVVLFALIAGGFVFWESLPAPSPVFINSVAFHRGGKVIAGMRSSVTKSGNNALKLWDVSTGTEICTLKTSAAGEMGALCFTPDGKTLVAGQKDGRITLWDWVSRNEIRTLDLKGDPLASFAVSPDGKMLATGSYVGYWRDKDEKWQSTGSGTVRLWDLRKGKRLHAFKGDSSQVTGVAFSPNGRYLAVGGYYDRTLKLCDPRTGKVLQSLILKGKTSNVTALDFSPKGRFIGVGTFEGQIHLWSMRSGKKIKRLKLKTNPYGSQSVNRFIFSPDGKLLAGASDRHITLWDAGSWKEVQTLDACAWAWNSLSFSPDGKILAAGTSQGIVSLLEPRTGRLIRKIDSLTWFERTFRPLLDWLSN